MVGAASSEEAPLVIVDESVPAMAFREDKYLEPITQVTPRIMTAVGATWSACFFVLMVLMDPSHVIELAGFSALGGSLFGIAWGTWFSWYVKRFHCNLLRHPDEYFAPEPSMEAEGAVLEVLGNQRVGHAFVGGKLVLTSEALWFLPHNRNGHDFRGATRIELGDITDLEIVPRNSIEILLTGPRPDLFPGRLRLTAAGDIHEFNVGTREMLAVLVAKLTAGLPSSRQVEIAVESGSLELAGRWIPQPEAA